MKFTFNKSRKKFRLLLVFCLSLINVFIIFFINPSTIFSFVYTVVIFVILNQLLSGNTYLLKNYFVLQLYIFLALLLYIAQLFIMPDWNGFSGMYGGIGTDDSRFYARISDNFTSIPNVAQGYTEIDHPFARFLQILYPFHINHPLTIIIPNLLGICFIPYFTQITSQILTEDTKVSKTAFLLVMFCPVILSNSLILMRDGWSAFLLIAGIFFLIRKKIFHYIIVLIILSFIRLGSGLLLAIVPIFYFNSIILSGTILQKTLKITAIVFLAFLFLGIGLPLILDYLVGKGISGLDRQVFVETFIRNADSSSMIYLIYTLPFYLKLPVGFAFFFLLPFLTFQFYTEGILNIRNIMFSTIMPILSLFYFKFFISGFIYIFKNRDNQIKRIFFIYSFLLLLISQVSIQPRHKTTIMPLFYILVSYGIYNNTKLSRQLGVAFAVCLGMIELYTLL